MNGGDAEAVSEGRSARLLAGLGAALVALLLLVTPVGVDEGDAKSKGKRDFGDAPDGRPAGYEGAAAGVLGRFPSTRASGGANHKNVGDLRLGVGVNAEPDSRQVDRDGFDDGFAAIVERCRETNFDFVVDAGGMPQRKLRRGRLYLNVWADWTQDGDWRDSISCPGAGARATAAASTVPEWVVSNKKLRAKSFIDAPVQAFRVVRQAGATGPQVWMRASVTERPFEKRVKVAGKRMRNDGRGSFRFGETEDSFAFPNGPVAGGEPEEPEESAACVPSSTDTTHDSTEEVEIVVLDETGNEKVGQAQDLSVRNLPKGWDATTIPPSSPAPPAALVDFREHGRGFLGVEVGSASFRVSSADTDESYNVSCLFTIAHSKTTPGDRGDAPDGGFNTKGTALEPLCAESASRILFGGPFVCDYPSLYANLGPVHSRPQLIYLGDSVDKELDSRQVDAETTDDGFGFSGVNSCKQAAFEWKVVIENPKRKTLFKRRDRRRLKRLIDDVKSGRAEIFLNAWLDANNDGAWNGSACPSGAGAFDVTDHVVFDERLNAKELRRLRRPNSDGTRSTVVRRAGTVGRLADSGLGCWRATLSVGQRFHPTVSLRAGHSVRAFGLFGSFWREDATAIYEYDLGETEDECPQGSGGGTPVTKCNDGKDNDSDGKIDGGDPGCQTGVGASYDPLDHNEGDQTNDDQPCPTASGDFTFTIAMTESGTLVRHILKLGGVLRVDKGEGDGDFDAGSLAPFQFTCTDGTVMEVTISWTRNGTPVGSPPQTPLIEFTVEADYVSGGTGTGTFSLSAAPNTR